MKRSLLVFALIALVGTAALAQATVSGRVVEAPDGRTLVLETSAGRITAQLPHVEVPDQDQPLFAVTRDHLSKMTVGKIVEIKPQRIVKGKTIGRMTLDGVDLSLQIIRDGAAWHEPKETSGQHPDEAAAYEANQAQAKNEKRGVWSIPELKTPWQVRAEKEQHERSLQAARRISRPTLVGVSEYQSDIRRPSGQHTAAAGLSQRLQMDNWVSVFGGAGKESYGILTYPDPARRFTMVYTSAGFVDFDAKSGKERIDCRAFLISPTQNNSRNSQLFLLGFHAISSDYRFSKGKSRISLVLDGRRLALGTPFGMRRDGVIGAQEIILYRISWATLRKIGNAKKVEVQMDKRTAPLSDSTRDLFKQLADATG